MTTSQEAIAQARASVAESPKGIFGYGCEIILDLCARLEAAEARDAELTTLRAEVAALRPVVEAIGRWRQEKILYAQEASDDLEVYRAERAILTAYDAYRAAQPAASGEGEG